MRALSHAFLFLLRGINSEHALSFFEGGGMRQRDEGGGGSEIVTFAHSPFSSSPPLLPPFWGFDGFDIFSFGTLRSF